MGHQHNEEIVTVLMGILFLEPSRARWTISRPFYDCSLQHYNYILDNVQSVRPKSCKLRSYHVNTMSHNSHWSICTLIQIVSILVVLW